MNLKFYLDEKCKKPYGKYGVDFGVAKPGQPFRIQLYMRNEHPRAVADRISVTTDHPNLKVVACTEQLGRDQVGELTLEWTPALKNEDPLDVELSCAVVWKPIPRMEVPSK